jgi:hypothetical protein
VTRRPNIPRLLAVALALLGAGGVAAALAIPASAPAAAVTTIRVNHACYQLAQKATLNGSGFDPSAQWSAKLDGSPFGKGTTDSAGIIVATFGVPSRLRRGSTGEDSHRLVVSEGKRTVSATFLVTHLSAAFSPQGGNVATLKVRFRLLGWGNRSALYLHYLNPKGVSRLDRNLGQAGGACGHLSTSPLKLFPFTPTKGLWMLQFDKRSAYQASSVPRVVIRYQIS